MTREQRIEAMNDRLNELERATFGVEMEPSAWDVLETQAKRAWIRTRVEDLEDADGLDSDLRPDGGRVFPTTLGDQYSVTDDVDDVDTVQTATRHEFPTTLTLDDRDEPDEVPTTIEWDR